MNNSNSNNNYSDRSPYPGYANHVRRFSNRFTERGQIRDGNERAEAGEVGIGRKSHEISGSRIRTSEFS